VQEAWALPDDSYTKLLLHFDGTNGSTNIIDECNHTILDGGSISTTSYKFGGSSAYFNGNSYFRILSSPDFDFGRDDFTIDAWVKLNTLNQTCFFYNRNIRRAGHNNDISLKFEPTKGLIAEISVNGTDQFLYQNNISGWDTFNWHHIALVRSGNIMKLYLDGTEVSNRIFTDSFVSIDRQVYIGCQYYDASSETQYYLNGYIDELRISKGIARWITNFTPPSSQYINYSPSISTISPSQNGTLFLKIKSNIWSV
jgi:hypothetical protein